MKIDARRLYTYPILSDGRDDYETCKFAATINYELNATNLLVNVNLSTDCADLKRLIGAGKAKYLLHVECPLTLYRETFSSDKENFSCNIPLNRVKKNLDCLALVVLVEDTKKFSCADWNRDFDRLNFNLQHGSVLAYQNFKPLTLPDDPNIFKNVASIFSVYRLVDDKPCEVDLAHDKIKVGLGNKDYDLYRRYCSRPEMQPILNAMIIFPALVYIFDELKVEGGFERYDEMTWFKSLTAAYRRKKVNDFNDYICDTNNTSIKLAQEVMDSPLTKALANVALIFDAEDS